MRAMATAGLAFQTLTFGVAGVWLVALIPAATITALKGRWPLFFAGFLTLGLTWIVGAVSLAPPDSRWARRFYGEARLARAADPLRHPRPFRIVALAIGGTILAIVMVGLCAARPSPILGIDGGSLGSSVGTGGLSTTEPCLHIDGEIWRCARYDDLVSGPIKYRVGVRNSGCWTARVDDESVGRRKPLSGCITIVDHFLG
jgi:hypothetical protein